MAATPAVELAPGVFRIPTAGKNLINSFALVQDDGSVTLVDTGLKKAPARIVAGLAAIGKHPRDVTRIVLTHVHPDHAGGAAELSRQTGAPVLVHGDDHGWARTGRIAGANDRSTLLGRLFARTGDARIEAFEAGCASCTLRATPPAMSRSWSSAPARWSPATPSSTSRGCDARRSRRPSCARTSR
jgi:glyoxylase-like metal-dependent hydrolase (beta-lactamase superfamily II)